MNASGKITVKEIAYIAIFVALMAICSWISIPTPIPFTLQTLGLFTAMGLLGGRRGTITIAVYMLLAALGVPVMSGFSGGLGVLLGNTGGYVLGFLLSALLIWCMERVWGKGLLTLGVGMVLGMVVYYVFGTIWFMNVYTRTTGAIGLKAALGMCVGPFVVPDLVKIALALYLTYRLRGQMKLD